VSSKITFVAQDVAVDCRPDETVLSAGLRAGLQLPYECASGGCGGCRAQVVEGSVRTLWKDATGLTERDRRRGNRLLMCQSIPDGDCTIKAALAQITEPAAEPAPEQRPGQLIGRRRLTEGTALFTVRFDMALRYLPGQFMLLESASGVRRAYSMAHPVRDYDPMTVEFVIGAKPEGAASQWLFNDIGVGDVLIAEGPYGRAYSRPESTRPVLCIAGGTGLAPILAITEHLLAAGHTPALHLYIGHRTDDHVMLLERLAKLHDMGAELMISVEHTAALNPDDRPFAPVRVGRVIDHVVADWTTFSGHDIYLAGPPAMIDAALRALVREGDAVADRVFFDRFL
jgi:toluene monooxygenase electron transfer component